MPEQQSPRRRAGSRREQARLESRNAKKILNKKKAEKEGRKARLFCRKEKPDQHARRNVLCSRAKQIKGKKDVEMAEKIYGTLVYGSYRFRIIAVCGKKWYS